MRQPRIKASKDTDKAYYHCISRVVERRMAFDDEAKAKFVGFLRLYEKFCCVRVVTFCVMGNHFHLLVEVPKRPSEEEMPGEDWLIEHVTGSYGVKRARELREEFKLLRKMGGMDGEAKIQKIMEGYFKRMWDVSQFMKTLKQRFTQWFNKRHNRRGTLWEDRFRSVLVDGEGEALIATAAYIDLNPLRAGIVADPADYFFSGYGEAVAGRRKARAGLSIVDRLFTSRYIVPKKARTPLDRYRVVLFDRGEERGRQEDGTPANRGFNKKQIEEEKDRGGRLPNFTYLTKRVRYFTRGGVIGSREFVNEVFEQKRATHFAKRKTGARKMEFGDRKRGRTMYSLRRV
ncbi:MAG: transposase [Verrucomicrobiota bacterium]